TFFDYLFGSPDLPTATTPDQVRWLWNNTDIADAKGTPFPGVGRNTLRANGWDNINASIFKNTKIHERYNLQLQFSAYNVLNHRKLEPPNPGLTKTRRSGTAINNLGQAARRVKSAA